MQPHEPLLVCVGLHRIRVHWSHIRVFCLTIDRTPAGTSCKIASATSKDLSRLLQLLGFAVSIMKLYGLFRQVWYDLEQQCIY
jgi:hypothetical protein